MKVTWDILPKARWERFHLDHLGALQQAWAYGQALASMGAHVHRAAVMQGDELVATAQFVGRRFFGCISFASCTRGPVWLPQLTSAERNLILREMQSSIPLRRFRVTVFSPDETGETLEPIQVHGFARVMTGYSTVLLDLTRSLETLRGDLESKWRNRLNKALLDDKMRVTIHASLKRCIWILGKEQEQREAKKFHGLPTDFVRAYIDAVSDPEQAFVVAYAELGKNTVAAMLFLIHGGLASYHMGWSDAQGRQLNAHNLLLWKSIIHFQSQGIQRLDLGGVNTHDLPGVSRFKLGVGGQVMTLAGTYF